MVNLRTTDQTYGEDYWNSLDSGAGYVDSPLWEDLAVIVKNVLFVDQTTSPWADMGGRLNHLDMGCAFGFLTRHLRRRGIESWGADISRYAITAAPHEVSTYLRYFDLTDENIGSDVIAGWPFDVVTCIETMEHIPEESVPVALGHIWRALRRGSGSRVLFTICTSSRAGWDSDPTHVTIKPREWWTDTLLDNGFVIDFDATAQFLGYYLFHDHDGVFVCGRR